MEENIIENEENLIEENVIENEENFIEENIINIDNTDVDNVILISNDVSNNVFDVSDIFQSCYLMLVLLNFIIIVIFLYRYLKNVFKRRG